MVVKLNQLYGSKYTKDGDIVEVIYFDKSKVNLLVPKENWEYRCRITASKNPNKVGLIADYRENELVEI